MTRPDMNEPGSLYPFLIGEGQEQDIWNALKKVLSRWAFHLDTMAFSSKQSRKYVAEGWKIILGVYFYGKALKNNILFAIHTP